MTQLINGKLCPVCGQAGLSVDKITVQHLVQQSCNQQVESDRYRICMKEDCNVVYYGVDINEVYLKEQVSVPIWFKQDANPKYACYCSKVTEADVIDAVVNHNARTVKDVNHITGAMKNANCKMNNPLGICCHHVIKDAIAKGLKTKK
jgi:bacterioferritin-associated ferredoxin